MALHSAILRIRLFPVLLSIAFISCGQSTDIQQAGGGQSPATEGSGAEGDAAGVKNSDVIEKPLLTTCYKGDSFACAVEAVILKETNSLRPASRPLTMDFESSYVARSWSEEQLNSGNISHDGFPYERVKVLKQDFPNASWGFFAENVAMSSGKLDDPEAVGQSIVKMWANSEGHLKNMLGNYRYLGVGIATSGNKIYATQIFH